MNLEQVQKMTDEELRIKVAKLLGLVRYVDKVSDYPNDLNAMHDAEATMTREQQRKYTKILHPRHITNLSGDWCILHATARQRAEAFVLTMEIK